MTYGWYKFTSRELYFPIIVVRRDMKTACVYQFFKSNLFVKHTKKSSDVGFVGLESYQNTENIYISSGKTQDIAAAVRNSLANIYWPYAFKIIIIIIVCGGASSLWKLHSVTVRGGERWCAEVIMNASGQVMPPLRHGRKKKDAPGLWPEAIGVFLSNSAGTVGIPLYLCRDPPQVYHREK